jgi:hypothetical protein
MCHPVLVSVFAGYADHGRGEVDFWRSFLAPFDRVELAVARNGTTMADVLSYKRIATRESGHASYVATELYNYDTTPIDPSVWAIPRECLPVQPEAASKAA